MKGLEITVEAEKRTQGIQVREEKTYSVYFDGDNEKVAQENIGKGIKVALNRLSQSAIIDIRIIADNYTSKKIVRIISRWGKIELRKLIGITFEIQEEYERKGHWKKKIITFINQEIQEYIETQKAITEANITEVETL